MPAPRTTPQLGLVSPQSPGPPMSLPPPSTQPCAHCCPGCWMLGATLGCRSPWGLPGPGALPAWSTCSPRWGVHGDLPVHTVLPTRCLHTLHQAPCPHCTSTARALAPACTRCHAYQSARAASSRPSRCLRADGAQCQGTAPRLGSRCPAVPVHCLKLPAHSPLPVCCPTACLCHAHSKGAACTPCPEHTASALPRACCLGTAAHPACTLPARVPLSR